MSTHEGPDVSGSAPLIETTKSASSSLEGGSESGIHPDGTVIVRGVWLNEKGRKAFIEMPTSIDLTGGGEDRELRPLPDDASVQQFLKEGGFVFKHVRGADVSLNTARVLPALEGQSKEAPLEEGLSRADQAKREKEVEQMDHEIGELQVAAQATLLELSDVMLELSSLVVNEDDATREALQKITTIQIETAQLRQLVEETLVVADVSEGVDEAYLIKRRVDRDALRECFQKINLLKEQAVQTLEYLKPFAFVPAKEPVKPPKKARVHGNGEGGNILSPSKKARKVINSLDELNTLLDDTDTRKGVGKGKKDKRSALTSPKVVVPESDSASLLLENDLKGEQGGGQAEVFEREQGGNKESAPFTQEDLSWRKDLDAFLERPEGWRVISTLKKRIQGEWRDLGARIREKGEYVPYDKKLSLWRQEIMPIIEKQIIDHLSSYDGIDRDTADRIYVALQDELLDEDMSSKKI